MVRKGGKLIVTIPLATRSACAIDLAIGERPAGPICLLADGHRMDRQCAPAGSCAGLPAALS